MAHQLDQNDPEDGGDRVSCGLERLPPLVRREILSALELPGVKALVSASPIFYMQYTVDRVHVVRRSLWITLAPVHVDAAASFESSSDRFQASRSAETVLQFLNAYGRQTAGTEAPRSASNPTTDQVFAMARFHMTTIVPLVEAYAKWALSNLASVVDDLVSGDTQATAQEQENAVNTLSSSERTRIMRALYRFQLFCNLFGARARLASNGFTAAPSFQPEDILASFFSLFEPWEVEEILCIHSFAKWKMDLVFDTISWDVDKNNPKFEGQGPPTPEGAFDLREDSWDRDGLLEGTISRGLDVLQTLVRGHQEHAELITFMQRQIVGLPGSFLEEDALSEASQMGRREAQPSDRDEKEAGRAALPFSGDGGLPAGGLGPPLAWTTIWGDTYSNLYGAYIAEDIRRWGYVMWDADRLRATAADQALEAQFRADWGDDDPRDTLY